MRIDYTMRLRTGLVLHVVGGVKVVMSRHKERGFLLLYHVEIYNRSFPHYTYATQFISMYSVYVPVPYVIRFIVFIKHSCDVVVHCHLLSPVMMWW